MTLCCLTEKEQLYLVNWDITYFVAQSKINQKSSGVQRETRKVRGLVQFLIAQLSHWPGQIAQFMSSLEATVPCNIYHLPRQCTPAATMNKKLRRSIARLLEEGDYIVLYQNKMCSPFSGKTSSTPVAESAVLTGLLAGSGAAGSRYSSQKW